MFTRACTQTFLMFTERSLSHLYFFPQEQLLLTSLSLPHPHSHEQSWSHELKEYGQFKKENGFIGAKWHFPVTWKDRTPPMLTFWSFSCRRGVMCSKAKTALAGWVPEEDSHGSSVRYLGSQCISEMHLVSSFPFISGRDHHEHEQRAVVELGASCQRISTPAGVQPKKTCSQPKPCSRGWAWSFPTWLSFLLFQGFFLQPFWIHKWSSEAYDGGIPAIWVIWLLWRVGRSWQANHGTRIKVTIATFIECLLNDWHCDTYFLRLFHFILTETLREKSYKYPRCTYEA